METPKWLFPLLEAKFATYRGSNPKQNNLGFFCLDCMGNPLSKIELNKHAGHDHIQVVKSSHEYAVKAADMVNRINCDKIHRFVINYDNIFYLRSRKSAFRDNVRVENGCKLCNHALIKGSEYCSLACKFKNVEKKGNSMEIGETSGAKDEIDGRKRRKGIPSRALSPSVLFEFPDSEIFHDASCELCKPPIAPKIC